MELPEVSSCPIAEAVAADIRQRSEIGVQKYGVTLARKDLNTKDWLQHAYEECLDMALYLRRLLQELERN